MDDLRSHSGGKGMQRLGKPCKSAAYGQLCLSTLCEAAGEKPGAMTRRLVIYTQAARSR